MGAGESRHRRLVETLRASSVVKRAGEPDNRLALVQPKASKLEMRLAAGRADKKGGPNAWLVVAISVHSRPDTYGISASSPDCCVLSGSTARRASDRRRHET